MDTRTRQLNILMETMRDVIKAKTCPDWVARKLADGVKRAKNLDSDMQETEEYTPVYVDRPFEIGEYAKSNIADDTCLYKIIDRSDPINGVNLYSIRIEKGDKNNPTGYIVYNVPETNLIHINKEI